MGFGISSTNRPDKGRWEREIRYQKIYGMTPLEANLSVSKEDGLSVVEIARINNIGEQTVKNTISHAKKKMRKDGSMDIIIYKYNAVSGECSKNLIAYTLCRFCQDTMGAKVDDLKYSFKLSDIPSDTAGDVGWMNENVFNYESMDSNSGESSCNMCSMRMASMYREAMANQSIDKPMMGWGVVKYILDRYYISYDITEVD